VSERLERGTIEGLDSGEEDHSRGIVEIDGADFMGTEHQNRQGQWRLQQIFDTTDFTPTVKRFPGPQILGELIVRMGGAGVYSGPGRMGNVAV
jgi:hypothetical protein